MSFFRESNDLGEMGADVGLVCRRFLNFEPGSPVRDSRNLPPSPSLPLSLLASPSLPSWISTRGLFINKIVNLEMKETVDS
jgi:hypothetical protein